MDTLSRAEIDTRQDAGRSPALPPALRRAWYTLNQTFRRRINHLGITPDQYTILRWLTERGDDALTQRSLTHLMASDPNTISSALSRMEASGLIQRAPHPHDRRANQILLTDSGESVFEQARDIADNLQDTCRAAVPESQWDEFIEHLNAVADAIAE